MAGALGRDCDAFLFASAIAARYARLACSLRMQSAYSGLGGCLFAPSDGLLAPALFPAVGEVGELWPAEPALPCACNDMTS